MIKIKCLKVDHRYKAMLFLKGKKYDVDDNVAEHLLGDYPDNFTKVDVETEQKAKPKAAKSSKKSS